MKIIILFASLALASANPLAKHDDSMNEISDSLATAFQPIVETMMEKIKDEFEEMNSQNQVTITVEKDEMATLVAEKLYGKIKEDLVESGTGIISQELSTLKRKDEDLQENVNGLMANVNGLMADKENRIFFSAYSNEIDVTGALKFPNIVLNHGNRFDGTNFVAPVKGYYTFTFSGQQGYSKDSAAPAISLYVKKNGYTVFVILDHTEDGNGDWYSNLSYTFTELLDENDSISLELTSNDYLYGINYGNSNYDWRLTFEGHLLLTA